MAAGLGLQVEVGPGTGTSMGTGLWGAEGTGQMLAMWWVLAGQKLREDSYLFLLDGCWSLGLEV